MSDWVDCSNEDRFEVWLTGRRDYLFRVALSLCRDPAAAEDLIQDACMKLWRYTAPVLDKIDNLDGYAYRALVNAHHDRVRRAKNQPLETSLDASDDFRAVSETLPVFDDISHVENGDLWQRVYDLVGRLRGDVLLLTCHGCDDRGIAARLAVPQPHVRVHRNRALNKLRKAVPVIGFS